MTTPSLAQTYNASKGMGTATPIDAELQIAHAENHRLQELNRQLESKLVVRNLALRQVLSLLDHEVRHRTNLSEAVKNIRTLLEGDK